ncbi:MAG TPA: HEAT repeat domain-containing protein [Desulfitobacteriaceae bacterium]|nr:HEAT repeat domain-containing protein [Desulfitobacteriaceae bacterium]
MPDLKGFFKPNVLRLEQKGDISGLIKALAHSDENIRYEAIGALCRLRDAHSSTLKSNEDDNAKKIINEALVSDIQDIEHLMWLVGGDYTYSKTKPDENEKNKAFALLVMIGTPAATTIIGKKFDGKKPVDYIFKQILKKMGSSAVEPLIARLSDEKAHGQSYCAEILGDIGDVRAVEPLIKTLKGWSSSEVAEAAKALGKIKDARAVEPLLEELDSAYNNRVREIAEKKYPSSYDQYSNCRENAAEALGQINDARAVELLIKVLGDDIAQVRQKTVQALGKLKDARALAPLEKMRNDKDSSVRAAADEALNSMGYKPALEPLIRDLSSGDWNVRLAAVEALERTQEASAFEPLARLLADNDIQVCKAVVKAVKTINKEKAEEVIDNLCRTGHIFGTWIHGDYREMAPPSHRECVRCGYQEICSDHRWGSEVRDYNEETDRTLFFNECVICGARIYTH